MVASIKLFLCLVMNIFGWLVVQSNSFLFYFCASREENPFVSQHKECDIWKSINIKKEMHLDSAPCSSHLQHSFKVKINYWTNWTFNMEFKCHKYVVLFHHQQWNWFWFKNSKCQRTLVHQWSCQYYCYFTQ